MTAAGLALLQRALRDPHWPRIAVIPTMAIGAPTLLAVQAAIALIYSGVQPVVLAPQLHVGDQVSGLILAVIEVGIGFALITGIADRAASLLLAGLVGMAFLSFPPLDAIAQLHWLGIALVVFVIGRQAVEAGRPRRSDGWNLPIGPAGVVTGLRVLTGAAIVAPALSEKLWNPAIAQAFLHQHPQFNFPLYFLGLQWFSNDIFILAAGIAEFTIGVLLITGMLTRVVILAMWLPFNVTVPFLPPRSCSGTFRSSGSSTSCSSTAPTWRQTVAGYRSARRTFSQRPKAAAHGGGFLNEVGHAQERKRGSSGLSLARQAFRGCRRRVPLWPADEVKAVAEREDAIPYDVKDVELGHVDGRCSFESIMVKYGLEDPALKRLAQIVHGSDVSADRDICAEAVGLYAIAHGFALLPGDDDHEKIRLETPMYDALYAWCQKEVG